MPRGPVARESFFGPSAEKIKLCDVHPLHPWLVTCDEKENVLWWDYEQHAVLKAWNLAELDEQRRDTAVLRRAVERDPEYDGPKDKSALPKIEKTGECVAIKFYDAAVVRWRRSAFSTDVDLDAGDVDESATANADARPGMHWIVVACEYRLLFIDYASFAVVDVDRTALEKTVTCLTLLLPTELVALGGNDGVVRVWDCAKWELIKRLAGGHQKSVNHVAMYHAMTGAPRQLVTASVDGTICVYNLDAETLQYSFPRAHDGVITQLIAHSSGVILTTGEDKRLARWDIGALKPGGDARVPGKHPYNVMLELTHPRLASNALIVCEKESKALLLEGDTNVSELFDLNQLHQQPLSKAMKIYDMHPHPLQPHIIACSTNLGVAIVVLDETGVPNHAVAGVSPARYMATAPRQAFFVERGVLRALVFQEAVIRSGNFVTNDHMTEATRLKRRGPVALAMSPSERYLSILYTDISEYEIYAVEGWKLIEAASATSIAWASHDDIYALVVPDVTAPVDKNRKDKKKTKQSASAQAPSLSTLSVRKLTDTGAVHQVRPSVALPSPATTIHGGLFLGVCYQRPIPVTMSSQSSAGVQAGPSSGAAAAAPEEPAMEGVLQLFAWDGSAPVATVELPEPNLVLWDPTQQYCLFGFPSFFCVFGVAPEFSLLCRIPLTVTSAVWFNRSLLYTTPTEIRVLFPNKERYGDLLLAAFTLHHGATTEVDAPTSPTERRPARRPSLPAISADPTVAATQQRQCLLPEQVRPRGATAALTVVDEYLLLFDAQHQLHKIYLGYPELKFRFLVAGGRVKEALQWVSMVDSRQHDNLAVFLEARGHGDKALKHLFNMSAGFKSGLCIRLKQYGAAVETLRALIPDLPEESHGVGESVAPATMKPPPLPVVEPALWSTFYNLPSPLTRRALVDAFLVLATVASDSAEPGAEDAAVAAFTVAAELEAAAYHHLIMYYVKTKKATQLTALTEKLYRMELYDLSAFAGMFGATATQRIQALEGGRRLAEAAVAQTASGAAASPMVDRWNRMLQRDPLPITMNERSGM